MPIQGNNMHGGAGGGGPTHAVGPYADSQTMLHERIDKALTLLRDELRRAMTKHRPMASAHEGHSVIREELDELWDHVKADTGDTIDARKEALQVAAMGLRYALDVTGL